MNVPLLPGRTFHPPAPPPEIHREEYARLPTFPPGNAKTRLERGRNYLKAGRAHAEGLHRDGASGLSVCRLICEVTDRLVVGLWNELTSELKPPADIGLLALGGSGRREMAPHSDVDLMLLRGPKVSEKKLAPFAQAFSTLLWDLKLVLGWNVRTPKECAQAAEGDHVTRTSLLDCRFLAGSSSVYDLLTRRVLKELLTHKADSFIADKIAELAARRERFGESIYVLEPNLKQGEGGLRDVEAALWIAQARYHVHGLKQLLRDAVLPASEVAAVSAARDFLMRIRNHLHYVRGRKEDRLTFEMQEEVARFLGYAESEDGLAVEQFMRDYYLSAKVIRRAADALIARCEESKIRQSPHPERRLGHFKVFRGKLTLTAGAELFEKEPQAIIELFRVADAEGIPLYSWARDQVALAIPRLAEARGEQAVIDEFKAFFTRPGTRGDLLFDIHDLGVLGAVLPEFGRVTARHQHDMYHVYTVDVHSLFAVKQLYALRRGDLLEEEPQLSRSMQELSDPLPLYLGMLLHDAGKGMGGDHSAKGKILATQMGHRLKLSDRQREIVEFLVEKHLLMSRTSQRRDLSDPELIAQFAGDCGDVEKLTCLYLLTYADIHSVAPNMWNDWKARLLHELFDKAKSQLLGENTADAAGRLSASKQLFTERWEKAFGPEAAARLTKNLPDRYFLSTDASRATLDARLLTRASKMPLASFMSPQPKHGFAELRLASKDRPGLLALFAGVLSAYGIDILRAHITSTEDGLALDVFDVKGPQGTMLERSRWRMARADLLRVLSGETSVEAIFERRRPRSLWHRLLPSIQTKVSIDNRASARFSVLDVRAQDQVGLLYAVASTLKQAGVQIALAKVATEANRAIDSFYLTRESGKIPEGEECAELTNAIHRAIDDFSGAGKKAAQA
jgi:[protein-PII] uridylyltransferase